MNQQNVKQTTIKCSDGELLAATVYEPTITVKGAILMAPATGIKRQFYGNFANYLASNGYGVITFDNRGIGGSSTVPVAKSASSLQCWGEKDMPAVLECLKEVFPNTNYHLVGHSAGGQLIGLMHNAMDISSMFNFACSSGQLKNMKLAYLIQAHFFMNFFIPFSNAMFGHTKSQWLGMGEPLPKDVAKQWQQWCNGQGYVKTAFGKTVHQHYYNELTLPSLWVNAVDDDIANNANVADMMSVFPKLNGQTLTLTPSDYGLSDIGHMKFFSSKSQTLWPLALNWLDKH
ncbi:alpha/beta hydrolase [Shewanella sp. Actino-trap-3]|uniref:alpha/beta hydrolase family protein n=1 Tax=Shewanella sp. Actino-trap-3 TaxID=2058331 RepID=UPI000C33AB1F|nr:alpha/beta fold hydrolase [Shewanella sp. Actino-trap-3]PKG79289.1 alpha/beta hydrolase [Shewanella sp. Actino-trap-3]|tara:strand:+ start:11146 stop:12009 length:864 start_codon:yes stop_codon:yes gene_type:complete